MLCQPDQLYTRFIIMCCGLYIKGQLYCLINAAKHHIRLVMKILAYVRVIVFRFKTGLTVSRFDKL